MWLRRLRVIGASEVNFWQTAPRPAGSNCLAHPGYSRYAEATRLLEWGYFLIDDIPMGVAWSTFGPANGVRDYPEFTQRLRNLRHDGSGSDLVGCVVLEQVSILNESDTFERR